MSATYDPRVHGQRNFARDFRRKMVNRAARQGRGGPPLTRFRVQNRFKPPGPDQDNPAMQVEPARVRLIPGNYTGFDGEAVPYFEYVEHFHRRISGARIGMGFICSKIWKESMDEELEGNGKCLVCDDLEESRANGENYVNFRRLNAFMMLHLDWYYLVPAVDKDGKERTYERDSKFHKRGDTIFDRVWCEASDKDLKRYGIKRRQLRQYEKVYGNLCHWSMGTNHLLILSSKVDELERHCKCGGKIDIPVYECPGCGHEVLDLTQGQDMSRREVNEIVMKPVRCPSCANEDCLIPVQDCDSCQNPTPTQLWDVDLIVSRQGTGTGSQLVINTHEICDLDERCKDLMPSRDLLHRIFAGDKLDYQADKMGIENPYKEKEARRQIQEYDKGDEADEAVEQELPV